MEKRLRKEMGEKMTFPEFDEFFDALIAECRKMRDTKGKEYAHSTSRFANFDRAAERLSLTRLQIANVYLHKHLDSIDSFIANRQTYSGENIRGRIVDAITYLTLIAGMITEEQDKTSEPNEPNVSLFYEQNPSSSSQIVAVTDDMCGVVHKGFICTREKHTPSVEHVARDMYGSVLARWW